MAVSLTINEEPTFGHLRAVDADVTLDSSYPTGGEALTAAQFGLHRIVNIIPNSRSGYVAVWDPVNSKLMMFEAGADGAPLDEVADTTDLSAEIVDVLVIGD